MAPVPTPESRYQIFVSIDFMKIDCASTSVAYVVNDFKSPISELLREWPGAGSYSKSSASYPLEAHWIISNFLGSNCSLLRSIQ
jgi:hypothetical protein